MIKISACVIVKNEAKNIGQWAENMKKITTDLIVVDTGSTDQTIALAKQHNAKVYSFPWENDFAAAKNFAIEQACGDWIIFLDADEYFTAESGYQVGKYIKKYNDNQKTDAFVCKLINVDAEDNNRYISEFYNLRIFKNRPWLRYANAVHEELKNKNRGLQIWVIEDDIEIIHTGYSSNIVQAKLKRNLAIIQAEITAQGENPWHYRYLCDCYYGLKDYEQAEHYAKLHIASGMQSLGNENNIQKRLIECMFLLQREPAAIYQAIERLIKEFPADPEFIWYLGEYYLHNKFYSQAETAFLQALEIAKIPKTDYSSSAFKTRLTQLYCGLGHINRRKNNSAKALEYYLRALQEYKYHQLAFCNVYRLIQQLAPVDIVAALQKIYNHQAKRDVEFIIQELKNFPMSEVAIYYQQRAAKFNPAALPTSEIAATQQLLAVKQYKQAMQGLVRLIDNNNKYLVLSTLNLKNKLNDQQAALILPENYHRVLAEFMQPRHNLTVAEQAIYRSVGLKLQGGTDKIMQNLADTKTSIIILTYNQLIYTKLCIESIRKFTLAGTYEIIVVDNNSLDGTCDWLKAQRDLRCIYNKENRGFPSGCNQGMAIASGTEILLLNNDTIVTPRWLEQMKQALYSDEKIAAVSCLTNFCSNMQQIEVPYTEITDVEKFANEYNCQNPALWERRLKLVGFCFLVKSQIVRDIGNLDEQFSPGNYEDDDYSLRLITAGYELVLCKDTFIHHFGSASFTKGDKGEQCQTKLAQYNELLRCNAAKLKVKWGIDANYSIIKNINLLQFLETGDRNVKILEIGCGCGGTLLRIKDLCPQAQLYGTENDPHKAKIASYFAKIYTDNIEDLPAAYQADSYDYIIFSEILETLNDPWSFVNKLYSCLKPDGVILAGIGNVMHWSVLEKLFAGKWESERSGLLNEVNLRFFTFNEVVKLFVQAQYKELQFDKVTIMPNDQQKVFIEQLKAQQLVNDESQLYVYQWLVKASKVDEKIRQLRQRLTQEVREELAFLLRRIENGIGDCEALIAICSQQQIAAEYLLYFIDNAIINKTKVLITIASALYAKSKQAAAISLLRKAQQRYSNDLELVYGLAFLLNLAGDVKSAINLLKQYETTDENIQNLYQELQENYHE